MYGKSLYTRYNSFHVLPLKTCYIIILLFFGEIVEKIVPTANSYLKIRVVLGLLLSRSENFGIKNVIMNRKSASVKVGLKGCIHCVKSVFSADDGSGGSNSS